MTSRWTVPSFTHETTKLVVVAAAASLATFATVQLYHGTKAKRRRIDLEKDIMDDVYGRSSAGGSPQKDRRKSFNVSKNPLDLFLERGEEARPGYDESLIREQLSRNYSFFGEEGMEKVRKGRVVVVGCGGVGSWAAVMLVRS